MSKSSKEANEFKFKSSVITADPKEKGGKEGEGERVKPTSGKERRRVY